MTLFTTYLRDIKSTSGSEHAELSFILIGEVIALGLVLFAFALGFVVDRSRIVWFAPFRIVLFSFVIAYGIATRKIMEVGFFLRRAIAYVLLATYLLALYGVIWWLIAAVSVPNIGPQGYTYAHVIAAIVVAFAMSPARGISQSLAHRLFIGTRGLDFRSTVNKATAILRSVTTLRELLGQFATTIGEALDSEKIFILLPSRSGFAQSYPSIPPGSRDSGIEFDKAEPIVAFLESHQEMIVLDELNRVRATPELDRVRERMEELQLAIAIGIFSREHLAGIMLLSPRRSGRIYGNVEQNALQVLCGQLAVAVENAELFTEVQNAKLYNETLLENLTSGVIAVGADGQVTVFNNEAGQITNLDPTEIIDGPVDQLPEPLRNVLQKTLRSPSHQENSELVLAPGENSVVVRASSSIFHGQEGEMLGALMVLTDITNLKRLEQQIRRSDRLASLGTLSAGMAHEIKNPLVSIKTFAQLLPERYEDPDFRETFSNLIGHEIDRIDSLVNQLLRFARPAKPHLKPMHVHEVLEKSLMLVGHRLYQKEIKLSRSWNAEVDTIRADADQLEQVFLNFFLNAMDAMKHGGELVVATEIRSAEEWMASVSSNADDVAEILRVTVQDNGEGIKNEHIAHVFDPFFTTKDYGTGLGLSVVHGIIQEHGGQIEVESAPAKGTSFHILLPLVRFQEEVAAA
ncbi:MAG: ATP-binding protein [Chthoniobacterales bacterium]